MPGVASASVSAEDHTPQCAYSSTDVRAQSLQLKCEEEFALKIWDLRVRYHEEAATTETATKGNELESAKERMAYGPALPAGWYSDINDPVLLTYDPYFRTHAAAPEAALPPLFGTKEGRYYAETALPICRTDAHSLRSYPPAGFCAGLRDSDEVSLSTSLIQSHSLIADRLIKAGEIIAMDVSEISIVEDPLVWRFFPPPPPSVTGREGKNVGRTTICATRQCGWNVEKDKCFFRKFSPTLLAAARQIVLRAYSLQKGEVTLIKTGYAQLLASLLLSFGDVELLPIDEDVRNTLDSLKLSKGRPVVVGRSNALLRSQRAERWVNRWCASSADFGPLASTMRDASLLLLQCVPPELLTLVSRDAAVSLACGGSLFPEEECRLVMSHYGFIRRVRLHEPERLARLLLVFLRHSSSIQVPDLPMRSGIFPFLRLLTHACRPNSFIMFLDSPASHCYYEAGHFDYNTTAASLASDAVAKPIFPWGFPCSDRIFRPSVAIVVACRDIQKGEHISHSLFRSVYMTQPQRSHLARILYGVQCCCQWCVEDVDVARAFRCPRCPRNCGVVCPSGDGNTRLTEWICQQCGYHLDVDEVHRCLDEERQMVTVKADKVNGLVRLLDADTLHYSHAIVFRKIDEWCQRAWQDHDASMCFEYLDIMQKSVHRVLDPCDPHLAQVHEFTAQVNHAVGSAHTARYEYFLALQIRLRSGMRYAHWTRKTWFMAAKKPLAEFLDSV